MRQLVPNSNQFASLRTPWTTYQQETPKIASRYIVTNDDKEDPYSAMRQHLAESTQLPKPAHIKKPDTPNAVDEFEKFLVLLKDEDKMLVRASIRK